MNEPYRLVMVQNFCHMCDKNAMKFPKLINWNLGWFCCTNEDCKKKLKEIVRLYLRNRKYIDIEVFKELYPEINTKSKYNVRRRTNGENENDWQLYNYNFWKSLSLHENVIIIWIYQINTDLMKAIPLDEFCKLNNNLMLSYNSIKERFTKFIEL